jgi:hypothetical protein
MACAVPAGATLFAAFRSGGYDVAAGARLGALAALAAIVAIAIRRHLPGRPGRLWAVAVAALALLTVWSLASSAWSGARTAGLPDFTRTLLYTSTVLACGLAIGTANRLRATTGLLSAAWLAVAATALATRLAPDVWPTSEALASERLSYPIAYWNGLGLLCGLALLHCIHFASDLRHSRTVRAVAAAGMPIAVLALYFTFSRAAIAATICGALVYLAVARPRGAPASVAALAPTGLLLFGAYSADRLASLDPTTPAAIAQGHEVAALLAVAVVATFVLRWALAPLDHWCRHANCPPQRRLAAAGLVAAAALAIAAAGSAALGSRADELGRRIASDTPYYADRRDRLADVGLNGRLDLWRVALRAWSDEPLHGTGAGTFERRWHEQRPTASRAAEAHSLPFDTLGELGLVGAALVAAALGALGIAAVRLARGGERQLGGLVLGAGAAWALAAMFDWQWELPAVTLWLFAVGGAAACIRPPDGAIQRLRRPGRFAIPVLVCVALAAGAVTAARFGISEQRLNGAIGALERGDDRKAAADAASARAAATYRPEPFEVLGYAALRRGDTSRAEASMVQAVRLDRGRWSAWYGLAIVRAVRGDGRGAALAVARRLAPREPRVLLLAAALRSTGDARAARRAARAALLPFDPQFLATRPGTRTVGGR